jgi:ABC-2 type transport system ATP-binding protein
MTTVLEFDQVYRAYWERRPVLSGVSLSLKQGEVVGLLGRNGTGKTTLLRLAIGLLRPQSGTVRVFGLSPIEEPVAVKKRVGYVAEDQVLPPEARVEEIIRFHRFLFPEWDMDLERQLLDRFNVGPAAKIRTLSKGEARRVALLCAVCHRPELLILDEPAGGLDPSVRREFLETVIQLLNREGTAILFSSHQMTDVERIATRVVLLDGGRVRLDESMEGLREGYCLAMVPQSAVPDARTLEQVPGCLRVRQSGDDWHAVFQRTPEAAEAELHRALGQDGVRCLQVPLEDLFVEMLGDQG